MANETVTVSNMPDSGSKERVALDLWKAIRAKLGTGATIDADIALYQRCLRAVISPSHPT